MKQMIRIQMRTFIALIVGATLSLLPFETRASSEISASNHTLQTKSFFVLNYPAPGKPNCRKESCSVFARIDKSEQMMYVYVSGELQHTFPVSTGKLGHPTPNLDLRPGGPLYEKYTSTKYPDGDYQGMGNMPYAVFLKGDYAIHGTTPGNVRKLGRRASHGCIRLHPDDARMFYDLVKSFGLENTWVTVQP